MTYSCPNCKKELTEKEITGGICSGCHKTFDVQKEKQPSEPQRNPLPKSPEPPKQGDEGKPVDLLTRIHAAMGSGFSGANGWMLLVGLIFCLTPVGWLLIATSCVWAIIRIIESASTAGRILSVNCPYCKYSFQDDNLDPGVDCPACKKRIVVRGKSYLRVE